MIQSQPRAIIVLQRLLVALCVSLWTLSCPRLLPSLPLSQPTSLPLNILPVLVYCLFCDAQTSLSCVKKTKHSV